jgi:hypothetical protein
MCFSFSILITYYDPITQAICYEYLFDSRIPASLTKCGHAMHETCMKEMFEANCYKCPGKVIYKCYSITWIILICFFVVCNVSLADMSEYFLSLERVSKFLIFLRITLQDIPTLLITT